MTRLLFLSGTARAGTSALVNILNQHRHIVMGQERYFHKFQDHSIRQTHFQMERFLDIRSGDTHAHGGLFTIPLGKRETRFKNAVYVGDKYPPMYRELDHVLDEFPNARHIYILRNPLSVVESYDARFHNSADTWSIDWQAGLRAWNQSVQRITQLTEAQLKNFLFIRYEEVYASHHTLNALFTHLGLSNLEPKKLAPFVETSNRLNEKLVPRRDDLRMHVAEGANWEAYRKICAFLSPLRPVKETLS